MILRPHWCTRWHSGDLWRLNKCRPRMAAQRPAKERSRHTACKTDIAGGCGVACRLRLTVRLLHINSQRLLGSSFQHCRTCTLSGLRHLGMSRQHMACIYPLERSMRRCMCPLRMASAQSRRWSQSSPRPRWCSRPLRRCRLRWRTCHHCTAAVRPATRHSNHTYMLHVGRLSRGIGSDSRRRCKFKSARQLTAPCGQ